MTHLGLPNNNNNNDTNNSNNNSNNNNNNNDDENLRQHDPEAFFVATKVRMPPAARKNCRALDHFCRWFGRDFFVGKLHWKWTSNWKKRQAQTLLVYMGSLKKPTLWYPGLSILTLPPHIITVSPEKGQFQKERQDVFHSHHFWQGFSNHHFSRGYVSLPGECLEDSPSYYTPWN